MAAAGVWGTAKLQHDPQWTELIARLLDVFGRLEVKDLELEREELLTRLVREPVSGQQTDRN